MRVLLVTPDYPPPPGGIQTLTRGIEIGLQEQGHPVQVIESSPSHFSREFFTTVPTLRLRDLCRPKQLLRYPYYNHCYRQTVSRINAFDPDVVHVLHRVNWPALLAADQLGVPSVMSAHALELQNESATIHATNSATRVHAVSEFTAGLVRDVTGISSDEITVIPPSINLESYRNATSSPNRWPESPVVAIARLVDRKNVRTLLDAWRRIDPDIKDRRQLIVVGDGPNRTELETEFDDEDVIFTGWISEEEKRSLLHAASVFALVPRRLGFDVEGFGIVYIEAQAAGTPVVGSVTGGVPEAVGSGGVLVDDETDSGEVAAAIESVLVDGEKRQELDAGVSERIGRFDIEPIAREHLEHYKSLNVVDSAGRAQ